MVQSKIETFTAMLAEQPENAMIWYGLASEQDKLENWAEEPSLCSSREYGVIWN